MSEISTELKKSIFEAATAAGFAIKPDDISLEHPGAEEHGDYSSNIALKLAKTLGRNPQDIAEKIAAQLSKLNKTPTTFTRPRVAGRGFINFQIDQEMLIKEVQRIISERDQYGSSKIGEGKTVVIDYSAPNIAKPFGIGHLRSTIIGQALCNLYKFQGYKVIGDNHLGDWGTQFGKLLFMINEKNPADFNLNDLEAWYVEFHKLAETNPEIEDAARLWFKRLEDGDPEAKKIWEKCVEISLTEFNRIYDLLGVKIDYTFGESYYQKIMTDVVEEAKSKKIAAESDGAWVIELPNYKTPLMMIKNDGATTYATRDLATLKFRREKWDPAIIIYEVGAEQSLHFQQVFAAARLMGLIPPETILFHTKHGLYRWATGKMSTRSGETVKLEKVLLEAITRAEKLGNRETSQPVGIGAVKYFDLKHNVRMDIVFDWEKMFELQGDSGPYLQYTYARARSVLRRAKTLSEVEGPYTNSTPEELAILRFLYRFPEVVESAAKQYAPNLICSYLFELSQRFNNLYNNCPILGNDLRLAMTQATSIILKNGLTLLGIEALERM